MNALDLPVGARASTTVRPYRDGDRPAWSAFVQACPEATFFHLTPWAGVIRRAFGHATHYAWAEQDGAVVGVLPLARMKTALFGDLLSSTPFCVYGGSVVATRQCGGAAPGRISTSHGARSRPSGHRKTLEPLKNARVASRYAVRTDRSYA